MVAADVQASASLKPASALRGFWAVGFWVRCMTSPRMAGSRFGGGAAVGYRLLCPVHPPAGEGALTAERRKALFAAAPAPHTKKHFPTSRFRRC